MRTVLLFAHECAPHHRPESTMGAQRPAAFARDLAEFGWRPVVICCDARRRERINRGDLEEVAREAEGRMRSAADDEPVVIATPSLRDDGWMDRVWKRARRSPSPAAVPFRRALTAAKWWSGDYSRSWQPAARAAAEAVAAETTVHACMGMHSPDAGLFLARWFHRRYGPPWIADFRDPVDEGFRGLGRAAYLRVARGIVRSASHVINVTEPWTERDRRSLRRPATCLPNGFVPDEFEPPASPPAGGPLVLAYMGGLKAGHPTGVFFEGVAHLRESMPDLSDRLRILSRGPGSERFLREARSAGVEACVDAGPPLPRGDALRAMGEADLLLLFGLAGDRETDSGQVPGKTYEYMGARRPVLCVSPGDGILGEILHRTGVGDTVSGAEGVAGALKEALQRHSDGVPLRYDPVGPEIERYTRRSITGRLAELLDAVTGPPSEGGS